MVLNVTFNNISAGFELTTLVVIGTDCIGSCKSNYHTIMTTTVPASDTKTVTFFITLSLELRRGGTNTG